MPKPAERVEYDEKTGKFDDIFIHGADIHIEDLGAGEFFIGIYPPDGRQIAMNAARVRVTWTHDPSIQK